MTWSNTGDEPGRLRETKLRMPPKGAKVLTLGGGRHLLAGSRRAELPADRRERLRWIARGWRER